MGAWFPFMEDDDVQDPRWSPEWSHLYDQIDVSDFGYDIFNNDYWKQAMFFVSGLPVVGDIAVMADSFRSFQDYMKNTGLDWSDIVYPALTGRRFGTSRSAYGALNYVSSNINRLYR